MIGQSLLNEVPVERSKTTKAVVKELDLFWPSSSSIIT